MFSDSIYQILNFQKLKNRKEKGTFGFFFLDADLQAYMYHKDFSNRTDFCFKTVYSWSQKPSYLRTPYIILIGNMYQHSNHSLG